jgi:hypothetical protein
MLVLPPTSPLPDVSDKSPPALASLEDPTPTKIEPDWLELPVANDMSPDLDAPLPSPAVDKDSEPLPIAPEALERLTSPLTAEALEPLDN